MNKYRWGILGTGIIAHEFAKGLRMLSNAELYSVYNRTFEKGKHFSAMYGFQETAKDLESFLKDPKLDVVYIATPNHLHCEQALRCLEASKHVLIEKPMALNVGEAKKIIDSARENNRFCMEAMWSRFMPVYLKVKELLQQKAIGDIVFCNAQFGHPMPYNPDRFRYSLSQGGGSLLDLGVYPISIVLMLLGIPERVTGECRKAESGVDTLNRITFHYQNGAMANLESTFDCQLSNGIWIGGSEGAIEIPAPISHPDQYRFSEESLYDVDEQPKLSLRDKVQQMPVVSNLISSFRDSIAKPLQRKIQTHTMRFRGNGYQFEAQEVMEMLDQGKLESQIMSLQDSVEVLKITDQLRSDWGIIFPQD